VAEVARDAIQAAVLTVSDRGAAGLLTDTAGPAVAAALRDETGAHLAWEGIVPDEPEAIVGALKDLAGEIRGLARRVASLNDRMRELFDLVVELEREPARAADLAARGRGILGHVHREMHGFVAAAEADAVRAEEGAGVVHRAAETVRALAGTLAESAGAARRIAEVAQQQESAFEQVMNAMNEIYLASEETASSTREVAEEAQALADLAARFRGAVRQETPE
jgi:methyl-accepting chemotaxis protein